MRKNALGAALIALAIMLASCGKEENSSLTLDLAKKAKVKAYIYAELNLKTAGEEYAPDGTKVIISIPNANFRTGVAGNYLDTVNVANGVIETEVPTVSTGVTVTLTPVEFVHNQVQREGSISESLEMWFSPATTPVTIASVMPGGRYFTDVYYAYGSISNHVETVQVKFELKADVDDGIAGEFVPSGTEVTLFNGGWSGKATVGASGLMEATVPADQIIRLRFQAQKRIGGENKNYRYTVNYTTPDEITPVLQALDFGTGELWE